MRSIKLEVGETYRLVTGQIFTRGIPAPVSEEVFDRLIAMEVSEGRPYFSEVVSDAPKMRVRQKPKTTDDIEGV